MNIPNSLLHEDIHINTHMDTQTHTPMHKFTLNWLTSCPRHPASFQNYMPFTYKTCLISSYNHLCQQTTLRLLVYFSVSCSSSCNLTSISDCIYQLSYCSVMTSDDSGQPCSYLLTLSRFMSSGFFILPYVL